MMKLGAPISSVAHVKDPTGRGSVTVVTSPSCSHEGSWVLWVSTWNSVALRAQ